MDRPLPTPDAILRLCAASEPAAWFPSAHAAETGTDRDSIDEPLNQLRLAGLVRIGGWEPGKGQCYVLTDAGRAALANGRPLDRLPHGMAEPPPQVPAATSKPGRMTAWDRGEAVRRALLTPGGSPITWAILAVQVIVFAGGLGLALQRGRPVGVYLETGVSPVLNRFSVSADDVARGEWWRLLTYSAVHAGLMHLLMNGIAIVALGPLLEKALGPVRFAILWVFGALGGGVAVVLAAPTEARTIGASGSICGLLTAAVAFIWLNRHHLGPRATGDVLRRLSMAILLTALISFSPGVSWPAHLGGAIAGLVTGVLLTYHRFGTAEQRWAALLGLVLLPAAGLYPLFQTGVLHWPGNGAAHAAAPRRDWSVEWPDFKTQVGRLTEMTRRHTATLKDQLIEPLREQLPAARNPALVRTTIAALDGMRSQQEHAAEQVRQAGPYQSPLLEESRKAAIAYLVAETELTTALRTCLARGPDWQLYTDSKESDEQRLQQLANATLEASIRWSHTAFDIARIVQPNLVVPETRPIPQVSTGADW
jgi:membrane associated rhomboid family serine protease